MIGGCARERTRPGSETGSKMVLEEFEDKVIIGLVLEELCK